MENIKLIIICEECGHVEHLEVESEEEISAKVASFRCPGECRSSMHSYLSIRQLPLFAESEILHNK
ncbi:MAG: hypothetical protein ONB24_08830 [candidate division KSB1 bacterium]|nr:hypothetical protein [candidate division KSB1 bacterium]